METGIDAKCRSFMPSLNDAVKESVKDWYDDVFPGHFSHGAARKYGYKPRARRYQWRKKKKMNSPPALVYSGYSKRVLNLYMRVTGTRGNVTGKFSSNPAMKYFWMRPEGHPNKPAEMKALTIREVENIKSDIKIRTAKKFDAVKRRKRYK